MNTKKLFPKHPQAFLLSGVILVLAVIYPGFISANPNGAHIVNGQVSIDTTGSGQMAITNSPNAIINWQNFSIAQNEITRFIQQNGQSAVLNRIIGENPSAILGQLLSNGKVFLINPNGIVFGAGATIDTQGLIASSLNLSDHDFLTGNYHFIAGSNAGSIVNEGIIRAGKDGNIVLIAPDIKNNGIIKTEGGQITLAAGQELILTNLDDPNIRFQVQAPTNAVLNLGKLLTEGGAVNVFAGTITHSGEINADSVQMDAQGTIRLVAQKDINLQQGSSVSANNSQGNAGNIHIDSQTGTTLLQGEISAKGSQTGKGGNIELLGERVGVLDQARINASGDLGGGKILVGGDKQGNNPDIHNARATYVGAQTSLIANAKNNGNGGKIIVWSNDATRAYGQISAKGGSQSGDGGFVETSGHWLDVTGVQINASAFKGKVGEWLLDPNDISIQQTGSDTNVSGAPDWTTTGDSAILTTDSIQAALNNGTSVSVTTGSAISGSQAGDITVNSAISKTLGTDASLTLNAYHDININASISSAFGKLDMVFNPDSGSVGSGAINLGNVTLAANGGLINAIGKTLNINSGATLQSPLTVGTLNLSNGVLSSSDLITVNNAFNWSRGMLSGGGSTAISSGATLSLSSGDHTLDASTLNLSQGANGFWSSGNIFVNNNATFSNQGNFTWNGANQFYINGTGSVFNNLATGVINNSNTNPAGTNTIDSGVFNNQGIVNVLGGVLTITSSGTDTGTYYAGNNGHLQFWDETRNFNNGSVISSVNPVTFFVGTFLFNKGASYSASETDITNATVNFSTGNTQSFPILTLNQDGAALSGSDSITVSNAFNFHSGSLNGTGVFTTATGSTTTLADVGATYLGQQWDNYGTINWQGQGGFYATGSINQLNNMALGVFNISDPLSANNRQINTNTFNNSGTLNLSSGALTVYSSGTDTGSYNISGSGAVQFWYGTRNFNQGSSLNSVNTVTFANGTVNFNNGSSYSAPETDVISWGTANFSTGNSLSFPVLTLGDTGSWGNLGGTDAIQATGTFNFHQGYLNGTGVFSTPTGSITTLADAGRADLNQQWNNSGTINWQGTGGFAGSGLLNNLASGIFNISDPLTTNNHQIALTTFNNQGLVNLSGGLLAIAANGTDTGTYNVTGNGALQFTAYGIRNFNQGSSLNSVNTVTFANGTDNFNQGSSYSAPETDVISSGTVNFSTGNSLSIPLLTLGNSTSRGSLGGSDAISVNNTFLFHIGELFGSGVFTTPAGSITALADGGAAYLNKHWDNLGTVNWQGQGGLYSSGSNSLLNNASGGVFNISDPQAANNRQINLSTFNNQGVLNLTGGLLNISSNTFNQTGVINIATGTSLQNGNGFVNKGSLIGTGTIDVGSSTLTNDGIISTGNALGALLINGNLNQEATGTLKVKLGGTASGQYDQFTVNGNILMGGGLTASLYGGYTPVNSDAIPFLTMSGTASGTFAKIQVPDSFNVGYNLFAGEAARLEYISGGPGIKYFDNGFGDLNWGNALNWSGNTLPGVTDQAIIHSGYGVLHGSGTDVIKALTINIANGLSISGGSLMVTDLTSLDGSLNITGSGSLQLNGALSGTGTVNVNNNGLLTLGNGASGFTGLFTNDGRVNINSGSLSLSNGGTYSGTFNAASGATLSFSGITPVFSSGSSILGAGNISLNVTGDLGLPSITANNVQITATGNVTQNTAISAAGLELLGLGGNYTLTNAGNNISTLAGNTGAVDFSNAGSFSIGKVNSSSGLITTGNTQLTANAGAILADPGVPVHVHAASISLNAQNGIGSATTPLSVIDTNPITSLNFNNTSTGDVNITTPQDIHVDTGKNTGGSIYLSSTGSGGFGNILVNSNGILSANGVLSLLANNSINIANNASLATTGQSVILNADADNSGAGNISMNAGTSVTSNGGNIILGGGTCTSTGCSHEAYGYADVTGQREGISLMGDAANSIKLDSGGGLISFQGQGLNGVNSASGIETYYTNLNSHTGNFSFKGTGGNGSYYNFGVYLADGTAITSSGSGKITIDATGSGNGSANYGLNIEGSTAGTGLQTQNGNIVLTGQGSVFDAINNNAGINLSSNVNIKALGTGSIELNGTGGGTNAASNSAGINTSATLTTNGGSVTLTGIGGNGTSDNFGVNLGSGSNLSTAGGALAITGTGQGTAGNNVGIASQAANLNVGAGNITLNGIGGNGNNFNYGVYLKDTAVVSHALNITGIAGQGVDYNKGVYLDGSNLSGNNQLNTTANLNITGTGNGTGGSSFGIYNNGYKLITQGGDITLTGTGGNGSSANVGVYLDNGSQLDSANGTINIKGTGLGAAERNFGIFTSSTTLNSGTGNISLNGTGGNGSYYNFGVYLADGTTMSSSGSGKITIDATGNGNGSANYGLNIEGSTAGTGLQTQNGDIVLTGQGSVLDAVNNNAGINLSSNVNIKALGTGNIQLNGTGGGTSAASNNAGINTSASLTTNGGQITLTGIGGNGTTGNYGVNLGSGSNLSTAGGALAITGTTNGTDGNNVGIASQAASLNAGAGNITLNGTGGNGNNFNYGVYLRDTSVVSNALNITGIAGQGVDYNKGVYLDGSNLSGNNQLNTTVNLTITGTGNGTGGSSFGIYNNGYKLITQGGDITLTGTGGNGSSANVGVYLDNGSQLDSANGTINIKGTGLGAAERNFGIFTSSTTLNSGTGNISLNGTGGNGSYYNFGVYLADGTAMTSSGAGKMSINATGNGNGGSNNGLEIEGSTAGTVLKTQNGDIVFTGQGSVLDAVNNNAGINLSSNVNIKALGTGNIQLNGTGGGTSAASGNIGINSSATLSTNGGQLTLTGVGGNGTYGNSGVYLGSGSNLATTSGTLNITGTGQGNGTDNIGIQSNGASLTGFGNKTLKGIAGNGTDYNSGISLQQNTVTGGNLTIEGTSGLGRDGNVGVAVDAGNQININGDLSITGVSKGTGTSNHGISIGNYAGGATLTTAGGLLTLSGTGGNGVNSNNGINISSQSILDSQGGALSIIGKGGHGTGDFNAGIASSTSTISSGTGSLRLNGTGGSGSQRIFGLYLGGNTITGQILDFTGTAGQGVDYNNGVQIEAKNMLTATGTLTINGVGNGTGGGNYGIGINDSTLKTLGGDALTLNGTGGNGIDTNRGISIDNNSVIDSQGGMLSITGKGGQGTANASWGISSSASTLSSGSGNLLLNGTGGSGSYNIHGLYLAGNTITGGILDITGNAGLGGDYNTGVFIDTNNQLTATNTLTIIGVGSGTAGSNYGISINNSTLKTVGGGALTLNGTGGNGGGGNRGISIDNNSIIDSQGGTLSITGKGGLGIRDASWGISSSASTLSSGSGNLVLNGTGGSGSYNILGIYLSGGNVITGGNLDLIGTAGLNGLGIQLDANNQLIATGSLSLTGVGNGAGSGNTGIYSVGSSFKTMGGVLSLNGTGGNGTDNNLGVDIMSSSFVTNGEALSITGTGNGTGVSNYGIHVNGSSTTGSSFNSGAGDMMLTGTGANGTDHNKGIYLENYSTFTTSGGALSVTGIGKGSGSDAYGIFSNNASFASGAGSLTLNGQGADSSQGLMLLDGTVIGGSSLQTGAITLIADTVSGSDSVMLIGTIAPIIQGSGILTLKPLNNTTSIGLADGEGTFNLNGTDLSTIQSGFSDIIIGSSMGSGDINLGASGWTLPTNTNLSLQNAGTGFASIFLNGVISSNANVSFNTSGSIVDNHAGSADIIANKLDITAATGISVDTQVSQLKTSNTSLINGTAIRNTGSSPLNIISLFDASHADSIGAAPGIQLSSDGVMNINGSVNASGKVMLTAAVLNINSSINGKGVDLSADNMSLNDSINAGSGAVNLNPYNNTTAIQLGVGVLDAPNILGLSDSDLAKISTGGSLTIGSLKHTGTMSLSALDLATPAKLTGDLVLLAGSGDINQNGIIKVGSNGNLVLQTTGIYNNTSGSGNALDVSGSGRWLLYSNSWLTSTEGGLTAATGSTRPRLYHMEYSSNAPASIESGNHLIYFAQPGGVNVTAVAQSKVYGTADPALTFTTTGLVTDDGVTDSSTAYFTGTQTRATGENVSAGPYSITQGSLALTGGYAPLSSYTNASLVITPATLSATIIGTPSKVYNGNTSAELTSANYQLTGFVGSEGATITQTTGNYNSKDVTTANSITAILSAGDFSATGTTLLSNYSLPVMAKGIASITPASLVYSGFTAANKVYDSTTTAGIANAGSLTGVIGADQVSVTNSGASFSDKNVGTNKNVTLNGLTLVGNDAGNYNVTGSNSSQANITPANLVLSSFTAASKVYDATNNATVTSTNLSGVLGTDKVSVNNSSASFADKNAGVDKPVLLNDVILGGIDASNYTVSYNNTLTSLASITPASLTVAANPQSKVFGQTDPSLTYITTGLFTGDTLSGALNRATGQTVGSYAIGQNTLSAGNNYIISYTGANLAITPASLISWTGAINNDWANSGNWNQGMIPDKQDVSLNLAGSSIILNSGTYNILTLTSNQSLSLTGGSLNAGSVLFNGGTLNLAGGLLTANTLTLQNGAILKGVGPVSANINNESGIVSPGFSPGKLTINGNYSQGSNGVLFMELAGLSSNLYDSLQVSGTANLGGTLKITPVGDYLQTAQVQDSFPIIRASGFSGNFSSIQTSSGFAYQPEILTNAYVAITSQSPNTPSETLSKVSIQQQMAFEQNAVMALSGQMNLGIEFANELAFVDVGNDSQSLPLLQCK